MDFPTSVGVFLSQAGYASVEQFVRSALERRDADASVASGFAAEFLKRVKRSPW